jgi:hypothetical protein
MAEAICYPKSQVVGALSKVGSVSGSPMGRRDIIEAPKDFTGTVHLHLLKMVDYCYDEGGAYWGSPSPTQGWMYRAWYYAEVGDEIVHVEIFIRAVTRRAAKQKVRLKLPKARFFR